MLGNAVGRAREAFGRQPLAVGWTLATQREGARFGIGQSRAKFAADVRRQTPSPLHLRDPGGRTGALPTRKGAREFAYCLRGKAHLSLGQQSYALTSGDGVIIERADACWENRGRGRAEVLVVSVRF